MLAAVESLHVQRANRRFVKDSMRAPLLTREREMELARRWREGDDVEALHELIMAYSRLVIRAASHYRKYGLPMSDLVQEGLLGLMLAAARFDPAREARFSTYASWWMRSAMQDFILRNWSVVRTGTTAAQKALFFNLRRLRARIEGDPDGPLSPEARRRIAEQLNVAVDDVVGMELRIASNDQSLNTQISDEGDDEWQDMLVDPAPSPEELVLEARDAATRRRWLATALSELSTRERQVIGARRLSDEALTLHALGQRLGISKERVRQIEHRALRKLRQSILRQSGALAEVERAAA